MATTCNVTGKIVLPDGSDLAGGTVEFALSVPDLDTADDVVIEPTVIKAVVSDTGTIDVNLWPNARGVKGSFYSVRIVQDTATGVTYVQRNNIQVPDQASAEITDLLEAGAVVAGDSFVSVITQTQYNEILDAAEDVDAAEQTATAAALQAQTAAIAAGAPLVTALTTPVPAEGSVEVLQTAFDAAVYQVQSGAWVLVGYLNGPFQASLTDTTVGRVLKVGSFGLGTFSPTDVSDFDAAPLGFSMCSDVALATNAPPGWTIGRVSIETIPGTNENNLTQTATLLRDGGLKAFRVKRGGTWEPWAEILLRGDILGTVAQSAGLPTGAIIESGSNANGSYARFADGTQHCIATDWVFSEESSGARLAGGTWVYPAPFAGVPAVLPSYGNSIGTHWIGLNTQERISAFGCGIGLTTASTMRIFAHELTPFDTGAQATQVRLFASGRWF